MTRAKLIQKYLENNQYMAIETRLSSETMIRNPSTDS